MLPFFFLVAGVALVAWAVPTALGPRRPLDLVAALAAALGVTLAAVGATALACPSLLAFG